MLAQKQKRTAKGEEDEEEGRLTVSDAAGWEGEQA